MKRAYDSGDSFATFNVSHGQMARSMKQMLDDKLFIDAKIASKSSPEEVLECHRNVLSASSKFFLRKFRKHTSPEAVIMVDNVTYQNLRYFLDLIYSGQAKIPKEKVSEFKVALFDLKFDKLADDQDESDDEEQDSDKIPINAPAKVMKIEPENSPVEQPSTPSTTPKKMLTSAREEVDRKPILQGPQTTGNFLENVFNSSKETLIPDFSAQQLHNASLNSSGSGSTIAPTPAFKPTFVAPPTSSSVISKPKAQVRVGLLNLFWLKCSRFSEQEMKKIEPPKNAKHFLQCKNGNDLYISFEIEAEAKEFLKKSKKGATPVQEVSFKDLVLQDAQLLEKELSARPRIQLKIENLPKWKLGGVLRMFKAHNILVKKHEVNYDEHNRCIFLQIPDKYLVEKIEQSFHGSVQDGNLLRVVIM